MADNPYLTVGAPNYATPIINWFGPHPENVGQQQNLAPPPKDPNAPAQPDPLPAFDQLGRWLAQKFGPGPQPLGARGQDPAKGGVGLPMRTTGGLY
jgi:hypothetical protein